jgi:hypothetical protein
VIFLSSDEIACFLSALTVDDLIASIWEKSVAKLTAREGERWNMNRYIPALESTIPGGTPRMHSNTVSLIETMMSYIFGRFTPVVWDSSTRLYKPDSTQSHQNSEKSARDERAWLSAHKFSLRHFL